MAPAAGPLPSSSGGVALGLVILGILGGYLVRSYFSWRDSRERGSPPPDWDEISRE